MPIPAGYTSGQIVQAVVGTGKILQVVSTTKTDTFTTTSTSYVDITGLTVSITPSATTSKILVIASVSGCNDVGTAASALTLARGTTVIFQGDAAGSRSRGIDLINFNQGTMTTFGLVTLDSPSTTSATTYAVQVRNTAAGTTYINRRKDDSDTSTVLRAASSITVMEVSA